MSYIMRQHIVQGFVQDGEILTNSYMFPFHTAEATVPGWVQPDAADGRFDISMTCVSMAHVGNS